MTRTLALAALAFAGPAAAQTPETLAADARAVLKRYCHGCHRGDGSSSQFRFDVLDHASLTKDFADDEKAVLAGKKLDSRIWVRAGVEKNMPPRGEKDRPTPADLEVLKKWIEAGAPPYPAPKARAFVSNADVLRAIFTDLVSADPADQPYRRYFTLAHTHNNQDVPEEDVRLARAALSKAINSMTHSPRTVLPRAVDPGKTVYAVDLRDLGWDKGGLWQAILREYPYGLDFKGSDDTDLVNLQKNLDRLTGGSLIYIRSDWFVATATRPPLYYALLQLPEHAARLESDLLKVDVEANFRTDRLARAGFQASGVSGQNRLVERHDSPYGGYYWKSYDFKPRRPRASLPRFPLGPEFKGNAYRNQAFVHDGGEMIFGLPNGLQAYFLTDGPGKRIDEGPIDVVFDRARTSGSPAIVNGLSCMHCHQHGTISFNDTIREGNAVFGEPRDKVRRLYPPQAEMEKLLKADEDRFLAGLERAIGPFLKVEENKQRPIREFTPEPVGEVTRGYLLADVTPATAAHELGFAKPAEFTGLLKGNAKLRELGLLTLAGGKGLRRDDWEGRDGTSLYQDVALNLGIGTPIINR